MSGQITTNKSEFVSRIKRFAVEDGFFQTAVPFLFFMRRSDAVPIYNLCEIPAGNGGDFV
ncbi:hypothetical protein SAMN05216378_0812 [Paenibacillus catalpae]|uniref:Uncharacterized protein n=1 Tax=Paenibacillus catalpae TaxID=1045775 RepID=A0A1I1U787_9BACL|nr:hypothetical protein SAMN05216378_0812 [Paenibacillus catalpae]